MITIYVPPFQKIISHCSILEGLSAGTFRRQAYKTRVASVFLVSATKSYLETKLHMGNAHHHHGKHVFLESLATGKNVRIHDNGTVDAQGGQGKRVTNTIKCADSLRS